MVQTDISPIEFFRQNARKYGDIFRFRAGDRRGYFINNPEFIKAVLVTDQASFIKEDSFKRINSVVGNGILTSDGGFYLRQRRMVQPAFHRRRIAAYGQVMADFAEDLCAGWQTGQQIDIFQEMNRLTLGIVAKTLFGTTLESEARQIGEAVTTILRSIPFSIHLDNYRIANHEELDKTKVQLDEIINRLIAERRAAGTDGDDMLSMLMSATDENDEPMSDEQLRDEAVTLLLAGHETVATALGWTWHLLSLHPEYQRKLQTEAREVVGDRPPAVEDLEKLTFTRRVLTESMRLYPPIWAVIRLAVRDCEIGGTRIPRDSVILMSQYTTHRDSRFFADADEFRPDRWTDDMQEALPQFAYFPFGGGMRRCIGEQFAWMEGTLLIAAIARRWNFRTHAEQKFKLSPWIVLRPDSPIELIVESLD